MVTVPGLKEMLKRRGLNDAGNRNELVARLERADRVQDKEAGQGVGPDKSRTKLGVLGHGDGIALRAPGSRIRIQSESGAVMEAHRDDTVPPAQGGTEDHDNFGSRQQSQLKRRDAWEQRDREAYSERPQHDVEADDENHSRPPSRGESRLPNAGNSAAERGRPPFLTFMRSTIPFNLPFLPRQQPPQQQPTETTVATEMEIGKTETTVTQRIGPSGTSGEGHEEKRLKMGRVEEAEEEEEGGEQGDGGWMRKSKRVKRGRELGESRRGERGERKSDGGRREREEDEDEDRVMGDWGCERNVGGVGCSFADGTA
ncbi:hypothetical protein BU26DRAFT_603979 [Trematosphaeria pertusa]|uniref:SAP domain-containing protein n=1 Tax=Trematosphaeria pertusa TaxID=390896 RepID=A0A6A6IGB2_9PLEO|nr:uncharacterized protein BU26DRAFT_603979 [Trematosphaeria pertusa]KAF2249624.1 hypothetical protein BU26DRAFT_603979 [Trematosphaeria pertusa]